MVLIAAGSDQELSKGETSGSHILRRFHGVVGVIANSTNSFPDWLAYCVSRTCGSLMIPAYPLVHPLSRWVAAGHDLGRVVTTTKEGNAPSSLC